MSTSSHQQQPASPNTPSSSDGQQQVIAQQLAIIQSKKGHVVPPQSVPQEVQQPKKGRSASWTGFSGKTSWDWLQLVIQIIGALAIPISAIALFVGVLQFNAQQRDQQESLLMQQQETILNTYLDRMSDLLLSKDTPLGQSTPASPVRSVAQARTITALNTLDPARQGIVIQFLHDSYLIAYDPLDKTHGPIIHIYNTNLSGINLSKARLNGVSLFEATLNNANMNGADLTGGNLHLVSMVNGNLVGATLTGVNLKDANLHGTNLDGANLIDVDLSNADLTDADLSNANLTDAIGITSKQLEHQVKSLHNTIMPDGTVHT